MVDLDDLRKRTLCLRLELPPEVADDYCSHIEVAFREIKRLREAKKLLHDATIVLRNGMGSHNHYDPTQKRGAGCAVCQQQRTARDEATRLIDQAAELAGKETDTPHDADVREAVEPPETSGGISNAL